MKIRYDFVTNSSSTSFVIINDGEFNLKEFVEAIGIDQNSEYLDIYKGLFESFKDDMQPIREYYKKYPGNSTDFKQFILTSFSDDTLKKILLAEQQGKNVYYGKLSSEENEIEMFFCTDSFIIDTERLFIDATEDSW